MLIHFGVIQNLTWTLHLEGDKVDYSWWPPARPTVTCIRVRTGDDEPYMPAVGLETTTSPSTSKVYILNG